MKNSVFAIGSCGNHLVMFDMNDKRIWVTETDIVIYGAKGQASAIMLCKRNLKDFKELEEPVIGFYGKNGDRRVLYFYHYDMVRVEQSEFYCFKARSYREAIAKCKSHLYNFKEV